MKKDVGWSVFLSDGGRYADLINGFSFNGRQLVNEGDVRELDTKAVVKLRTGKNRKYLSKTRDMLRRVVFGINFVIIGTEAQECRDYAYPVRNVIYDASEYEKQLRKVQKRVRKHGEGLSAGEYMYGFRKDDRLKPVVTYLIYAGEEEWDKPLDLWDILDFSDIPDELQHQVQHYKVNIIDIRRLEDTSVFKTDIREVFEFIRCSRDRDSLKELVNSNEYFQHMDEDAFDVAIEYSGSSDMGIRKEDYKVDGGVSMCTAIKEMIEEGYEDGLSKGLSQGEASANRKFIINMHRKGYTIEQIVDVVGMDLDEVTEVVLQESN